MSCSGSCRRVGSTLVIPAASTFSMVLGPTPAKAVSGVVGAVSAVICSSIFAALLFFALDVNVPANEFAGQPHVLAFLANRQGELRILNDDFELRDSGSTICTRVTFAGLSAFCANATVSSLYGIMSIFSPRSSRMIDCTRMPSLPTQAPTGSTSLSRLATPLWCVPPLRGLRSGFAPCRRKFPELPFQTGAVLGWHPPVKRSLGTFRGTVHHLDDHAQALTNM